MAFGLVLQIPSQQFSRGWKWHVLGTFRLGRLDLISRIGPQSPQEEREGGRIEPWAKRGRTTMHLGGMCPLKPPFERESQMLDACVMQWVLHHGSPCPKREGGRVTNAGN